MEVQHIGRSLHTGNVVDVVLDNQPHAIGLGLVLLHIGNSVSLGHGEWMVGVVKWALRSASGFKESAKYDCEVKFRSDRRERQFKAKDGISC